MIQTGAPIDAKKQTDPKAKIQCKNFRKCSLLHEYESNDFNYLHCNIYDI